MSITADELARTESAEFDFQLSTTLTAAIDEEDEEIPVVSTSAFIIGTFIIVPKTDAEEYEYVSFGTKTATAFRELVRGQPETPEGLRHASGANVQEWVEITSYVHTVSFKEDYNNSVSKWQLQLNGQNYNSRLINNDNSVLVLARYKPKLGGTAQDWTDWKVFGLGYINSFDVVDDSREGGLWKGSVEGLSQYMENTDIPAQEYGSVDVALNKTVSTSSYLTDPTQEPEEVMGYPDLDGSQMTDDDKGTLWISEGEPSSTPEGTTGNDVLCINEVLLEGIDNLQYVEVFHRNPLDDHGEPNHPFAFNELFLVNKETDWKWAGWTPDARIPTNNFILIKSRIRLDQDGGFAILTNNATLLQERYNVEGNSGILDWRAKQIGAWDIDETGDFLALMFYGSMFQSVVWFGEITPYDFQGEGDGSRWTGRTIIVPTAGHTFRRSPTGEQDDPDSVANWNEDEDHPTPGHRIFGDPEWARVDMGALGRSLSAQLDSTEFGEISVDSVFGFDEGPADCRVSNTETITYQTRDSDNNKLLTLTRPSPITHPIDSPIAPYEGGAKYNMHRIKTVEWSRKIVLDANGNPIVPKNFDIYTSVLTSPLDYDETNWELDWTIKTAVRDNANTSWRNTFDPVRARHVMIVIFDMTDSGRVKINTMSVYSATANVADGDGGGGDVDLVWSGDVVKYIMTNYFGLDPDLFTMTDHGKQFVYLPTIKTSALNVIQDICKRSGCMVRFNRDHSVEHMFDPCYPLGVIEDISITWDRDNARNIKYVAPFKHSVSQVHLFAKDPATDENYEAVYPPTPLLLGSERRIEDYVLGSAEDAVQMAQFLFTELNGLRNLVIQPKGPGEWASTCQRHVVDWTFDENGALVNNVNFVVAAVDLNVAFGAPDKVKTWGMNITLKEMTL
jgi:hypothetical protein